MGFHRIRGNLHREKKKLRKSMNNFPKSSTAEDMLPKLPLFLPVSREEEYIVLRRKLKPFYFSVDVDDYVLPNGDAICDTIKCTAFYEIMSSVPVIHIVDVKYDNLLKTEEFGELLSIAYDKVAQKLDICQKV